MTQAYDWPGRAEIAARAKERWRRRRPLFVVIALVGGAAGVLWGSTRDHSSAPHHHSSLTAKLVALAVAIVVVAAVVALTIVVMRRLGVNWRESYRAPITLGLPRPQRREVARAIRRGVPSTDPTLLAVERESAERLTRRRRTSQWVLPIVIALELVNAFAFDRGTGSRFYFVILAVLLLFLWLWSLVYVRGADRLLAASRPPD